MKDSQNGSEATICSIYQVETLPVLSKEIQRATRHDPVLSRVLHFTRNGWSEHVFGRLKSFHAKQYEILVVADCLLWVVRVIIPKWLQNLIHRGVAPRPPRKLSNEIT